MLGRIYPIAIACQAKASGKRIRVGGQRHSQPPLVVGTNATASTAPVDSDVWVVDLRCYSDLETEEGSERIQLKTAFDPISRADERVVFANAGVREDELSEFLQNNNLMPSSLLGSSAARLLQLNDRDDLPRITDHNIWKDSPYP